MKFLDLIGKSDFCDVYDTLSIERESEHQVCIGFKFSSDAINFLREIVEEYPEHRKGYSLKILDCSSIDMSVPYTCVLTKRKLPFVVLYIGNDVLEEYYENK